MNTNNKALRLLCLLSLCGFVYCMAIDATNCYVFAFLEEVKKNPAALDGLQSTIDDWETKGIVFNEDLVSQLIKLYAFRVAFDVLALLGVALVYFRIKLGLTIYIIFQLSYVVFPFALLGQQSMVIFPIISVFIHLLYIVLFLTQKKKLH